MADEVWVIADRDGSELSEVTLEILGEARGLAKEVNGQVCAIILGHQIPKDIIQTSASYGADKVYLVEHKLMADYTTDIYMQVMANLILELQPSVIIFGATANGSDLATRLAARLKIPIATDCIKLEFDYEKNLNAIRPAYGNQVYITLAFAGNKPYLATIRPGVIGVEQSVSSRSAELVQIEPKIDSEAAGTRLKCKFKPDPSTLPLNEAELVMAGGGGITTTEGWSLIEELADALGASVGGSRVAEDKGFIPAERVIGQSGITISPRLYIAAGISGATHHTHGMKDSKTIVAINTDSAAPIFGFADLKVICDLHQLLPELNKEIRQARGIKTEETSS